MRLVRGLLVVLAGAVFLLIASCALLPSALSALNPGIVYRVPDSGRTLYLTLDDGPSASTPQILAVLRRHEVQATFFVVSDHIRPEWMKAIQADGHQIAHHMKTTARLSRMPEDRFRADFIAAERALAPYGAVKLFRPPGGFIDEEHAAFVKSRGYAIVVGTVYPLDHLLSNPTIVRLVGGALAIEGGILILHDTTRRGPVAAAALDQLLPQLKRRGFRFALLPGPQA